MPDFDPRTATLEQKLSEAERLVRSRMHPVPAARAVGLHPPIVLRAAREGQWRAPPPQPAP